MGIAGTLRALSVCLVVGLASACGGGGDSDPGGAGGAGGGGGTGGSGGRECAVDADCTGDLPLCAPDGRCVLCLSHADCPLDAPSCLDGACLLCGDESSCEGRGHCDPVSGGCVTCVADADCDGGVCTPTHRCVECLKGSDCPSGICNANVCAKGDACNDQVKCKDGLICVTWSDGALFGTCETICDLETQTGCEDGRYCQLITFDKVTFDPIGLCMEPNGGPKEGEPCGDDPVCEANLICVNYGAEVDECVSYCDPDAADTCGEGRACEAVRFSSVPNTPAVHVCTKKRVSCATDADCAAEETCNLVSGPNDVIELACTPRIGAKKGGESCVVNGECATGFCIQEFGVCYGACGTGADCVTGTSCAETAFSSDGGPTSFVPACVRSCGADRDCRPNEGCGAMLSFDREEWITICSPSTGTASAGEACTTSLDCRGRDCEFGIAGTFCTGPCRDDRDCGGDTVCVARWRQGPGPDDSWYTADDIYQPIGMCRGRTCTSDEDCGSGACVPETDGQDPRVGQMQQRCSASQGTIRGGEPCTWSPDACRSGTCGEAKDGRALCFEACTAAADCADGMVCEPGGIKLYHGFDGTNLVYEAFAACVPAPPEEPPAD